MPRSAGWAFALCCLLLCGCDGERPPASPDPPPATPPAPPLPARVDGVWIMDNPPEWSGPPMIWTLVQSGSEVTGTAVRMAPFVVRDTGAVTGTVTETQFTLTLVHVVEHANPGGCNPSTTTNTGVLNVTRPGDVMSGFIVRTDPRVCALRVFTGQPHTLRKQTTPLPPQPSPMPVAVTVTYRPGPSLDYPRSTGCTHHYAPLHLDASLTHANGARASARLGEAGAGVWQATIAGAWPGAHRIVVTDIGLCPREGEPWSPIATSGVSVNGVQLTRAVQSAIVFTLAADGSVQP